MRVANACHLCFPDTADLHGYVVAVAQTAADHDLGARTDQDPVVWEGEFFFLTELGFWTPCGNSPCYFVSRLLLEEAKVAQRQSTPHGWKASVVVEHLFCLVFSCA